MDNKPKFILSELRQENGMTQNEIAQKLRIATSTYNMYENGIRNIPCDKAKLIADLLGVRVEEIFLATKFTVSKYL